MSHIVVGRASDPGISEKVLKKMYQLRHDVFFKKLGWRVDTQGDEERDDYDHLSPHYMVSMENQVAVGCWRLLPTSGPYMLKNTFTDLLRGEDAPDSADVWELSRFAVTKPAQRYRGQILLGTVAYEMLERLIMFADLRGIREYVTVVSTSVERLMTSNGLSLLRLGDGEVSDVDGIPSVGCRIAVDQQTRDTVSNFLDEFRTEQYAIAQ